MQTYRARVLPDWEAARAVVADLPSSGAFTPFQGDLWLGTFHRAFAARPGIEPLPVHVTDGRGETAMLLPFVRIRGVRSTAIEFADLGITDYNLPIVGPAVPVGREASIAAFAAVRAVLPRADLAIFTKMPARVGPHDNPLVLALPTTPSRLFGNLVATGDDYAAWVHSLGKHERKELGRLWRVFTREPDTRFVRARTAAEAEPLMAFVERAQAERIRALGLPYILDDPDYARFYRLLLEGLPAGRTIVTGLVAGEEVVAALFMVADATQVAMIRIAFADGRWANASPGRLVIERTMAALHAEGIRVFDFTIGDYGHKRAFRTEHLPLFDARIALGVRGLPSVGLDRAKAFVRNRPALERLVRGLLVGIV